MDRASLLGLSAPELTALVGGLRVLDTNWDGSRHGVFTERPGQLTNDFFVNLFDMGVRWSKAADGSFEAKDRASGEVRWTGTRVDLIFGHDGHLRAVGEAFAADDGHALLVETFVRAWDKVMMADRYDLDRSQLSDEGRKRARSARALFRWRLVYIIHLLRSHAWERAQQYGFWSWNPDDSPRPSGSVIAARDAGSAYSRSPSSF